MRLLLEEVIESGYRPLATLDGRSYQVGRDLTADIPFSSQALSRLHGKFVPFPSGWIFKDLGSTNGSWHNGNRLKSGLFVALKDGDFLQLADVIVKIKYVGDVSDLKGSRLMIVKGGEPLKEILFTEFNPTVTIGDEEAHLLLRGHQDFHPAVRFDFIDNKVTAAGYGGAVNPYLNGEPFRDVAQLARGDVISIGEYECIYIDTQLIRYQGEPRTYAISTALQPQVDLTEVTPLKGLGSTAPESKPQVFSPRIL